MLLAVVGLAAQLVDGSLGMAYGVTSQSLLLAVGIAPALASAAVHIAEVGTTAASGASHWRFGNIDWDKVRPLAIPGAIGAFLGAVVISRFITGCMAGSIVVGTDTPRLVPRVCRSPWAVVWSVTICCAKERTMAFVDFCSARLPAAISVLLLMEAMDTKV